MKDTHIELIDPKEKLSVELGGYGGYLGPKNPDSVLDLMVNAKWAADKWPELNMAVWKVLRSSVNWKGVAQTRRLRIAGRTIPCDIIGGVKDWWFVSVNATKAAAILQTANRRRRV